MPFSDGIFGSPEVDEQSFIDPAANVIGKVIIESLVIVAPGSSLRADEGTPFKICKGSNLQDNTVMHGHKDQFVQVEENGCMKDFSVYIGERTTIAHRTTLHGPLYIEGKVFVGGNTVLWSCKRIGSGSYIDIGARIKNATIGRKCYVGINAIVSNGVHVPDGKHIPHGVVIDTQEKAEALNGIHESLLQEMRASNIDIVEVNIDLVEKYRKRAELLNRERSRRQFARLFHRLKTLQELLGNRKLSMEELLQLEEEELMAMIDER